MFTFATQRIRAIAVVAALATSLLTAHAYADKKVVEVWKTPTCGCCQAWVDYLEDNDYKVKAHNLPDLAKIKANLGLTDQSLHSCHTAVIDGYVIEGHVPVADMERLLTTRPDILGLTAPGMPLDSPGMRSIEPRNYDVLQVDHDQKATVFTSY